MCFWDWKTGYNFQKAETKAQPGSLESEAGERRALCTAQHPVHTIIAAATV